MIITLIFGLIVANVFTSCSDKEELDELTEEIKTLNRYCDCHHLTKDEYSTDCVLQDVLNTRGTAFNIGTIYSDYYWAKENLHGEELSAFKEVIAERVVGDICRVYQFNKNAKCIHLHFLTRVADEIRYYVVKYVNEHKNAFDAGELQFVKKTLGYNF